MSIRELCRSYLAARSMTPNEFAKMVEGVSRTQVYDFFNGTHDLTTAKADAVLTALSVPMPAPAPAAAAWVVVLNGEFWNGRKFGPRAGATRYPSWDEAVEAAQEGAALPPNASWAIEAV